MKGFFEKYKKHIPNILTTLRLAAVPAFWGLTLTGNPLGATILFGSACLTDALDGYLARRWKVESIYGKVTDPLADKMLVMSALLLNGITTHPLMLMPFFFESAIAFVNIKSFMKEIKVKDLFNKEYLKNLILNTNKAKVSQTGREKTVLLMSTVSLGLLNIGLNLNLGKIVSALILITGIMESATLLEYIEAKMIEKPDFQMRLPNFNEQESTESVNKKNVKKLTKEERINLLKKEKHALTQTNNKGVVKKKKISRK